MSRLLHGKVIRLSPVWAGVALILGLLVSPAASSQSAPFATTVGRYDVWEASYQYSSTGLANPYEQIKVVGTFTAPSGRVVTWPGFYYGANEFRVRFVANELGNYTYSITISGNGAPQTNTGGFTVIPNPKNRGWLKPSPTNPYRLVFQDNTTASMVGMQTSWGDNPAWNLPGGGTNDILENYLGCPSTQQYGSAGWCDASDPGSQTPAVVTHDVYFLTMASSGFNLWRQFLNLASPQVVTAYGVPVAKGGPGNKYSNSPPFPGIAPDVQLQDTLFATAHANGFHIQLGFFCGSGGCNGGAYDGTVPLPVPTAETNAIDYIMARYGAWADIFEIDNEGSLGANNGAWQSALRDYIRSIDPYHRMVTNSFPSAPDWNFLDLRSPHGRVQDRDSSGFMSDNTNSGSGPFTTGKPVMFGEIYVNSVRCNPDGVRFLNWESLFSGLGLIYWGDTGTACNGAPFAGSQSTPLGARERASQSVLAGIASDGSFTGDAVASRPTTSWTPPNNGQGVWALGGPGQGKVVIWGGSNESDPASYTFATTYDFPFAGTGSWIDTIHGSVLGTTVINGGTQTITSPSFTKDIAFVIGGGAVTPPAPTPTSPPSVPTSTPGPSDTNTAVPTNTSTPTLTPTPMVPPGTGAAMRAHAGTGSLTDHLGNVWAADSHVSAGNVYAYDSGTAIAGTLDPALYQTERYGTFTYSFPMANGPYDVTLKFAEMFWTSVGRRVFNVSINGAPVLTNFDIFSAAGGRMTAVDRTFTTNVTNGAVTIAFTPITDQPKINAIQIVQSGPPAVAGCAKTLTYDGTPTLYTRPVAECADQR